MFWCFILVALLVQIPAVFAADPAHPNGDLYYIILENFEEEERAELDALAMNKFKTEVESRGYRLVLIKNGNVKSIKDAAFNSNTSVIVLSGHGTEDGKVTSSPFEISRLRSIFGSKKISAKLRKVVIGTCYSSCVAENWNLKNGKIVPLTFGHFPIGVEWFQDYLGTPAFLSQLGTPKRAFDSGITQISAYELFRAKVNSANTFRELQEAVSAYKLHVEFDPAFDASRIREEVYKALLKRPEIKINLGELKTATDLDLSDSTLSDMFFRFSQNGPSVADAEQGLRILDKLAKTMPIESGTSAISGAQNLAKMIQAENGSEYAIGVLRKIKDDDIRGAFGFELLKSAKTAREYLNVLKRLPNTYAAGTFGIFLKLSPSADEILESFQYYPTGMMVRNNFYLVLQKIRDPDDALKLFRGFKSFAKSSSDREIFDENLTDFFRTNPEPKHYRDAVSLCQTSLCREFVMRNFVSLARTPEELKATSTAIRRGKLFLEPRVESAIRSRAAALEAEVPSSFIQSRATELLIGCQKLFGDLKFK